MDQAFPIVRRKTYELVAQRLLEDVATGVLGPGALVPAEIELAEALRVGRSSVREALRVLESRGLITREGSGRFSVTENANPISEALNVLYALQRIEVEELFDLRRLIEVESAGVAASRRGADDLTRIGEAVGAMRWGSVSQDDLHEADTRFHVAVAAATQNRATVVLVEALRHTLYETLHAPLYARTAKSDWSSATMDEHVAIVDAIAAQDQEGARSAMRAHLDRVGRQALNNLERVAEASRKSKKSKE
jgi:GntR family transcriptional repressor for pyruvate dehydrogenase complex